MDKFSAFADAVFKQKYSYNGVETWEETAKRVVKNVMGAVDADAGLISRLISAVTERKFLPGGRYLYASGRPFHQVNNCLLLRAEDSREGWADLMQKATMSLMTGAGIGVDYSAVREEGANIRKTGGKSTGPLALMQMVNEAGRHIMQGGARRCLPANTKVMLEGEKLVTISEVKPGQAIWTRHGYRTILAKESSGKQQVYELVTTQGVVKSTGNHRWLAARNDRSKDWYEVDRLKVGHKLYFHPFPEIEGNAGDVHKAYTIGYFMGDGCAYHSGRTHEVTFQFSNDWFNKEQIDKITAVMRQFGTNPVLRNGHGDCLELRCRGKEAVNIFQVWKKPHAAPVIPEEIWAGDISVRLAFLAGWMDADGYYGEDSWKLANKHESTRKELCRLFETVGIVTTINGMEVRLNSYQRSMLKTTLGKFSYKLPKDAECKDTAEIPAKILSITPVGIEEVWDIQVQEVEEFIADGFVSHNSAIWAGLNWKHPDIFKFIHAKNWSDDIRAMKAKDFNAVAPLDGTNISVILDRSFFRAYNAGDAHAKRVYSETLKQMLSTAEPGFSVDYANRNESLRNACTEVVSEDDSDVCNLGSINLARIDSLEELKQVVSDATAFLMAGTVYSDLPYEKVAEVRKKNRRLGLGLMGIHEWLIKRGYKYEPTEALEPWLEVYQDESDAAAEKYAKEWRLSIPVKVRALAPTGTIGIVAETTTGIEPIFCVAYRRRYKGSDGKTTMYQYVIDPTAKRLIEAGAKPENIEDAYTLSENVERRVAFQAWVQQYVDQGISSTINLPPWGSDLNNESHVTAFGKMLMKYLPKLRGVTCYPDGCRSGQPLVRVAYETAMQHEGQVFVEAADICDISGKGGSCGS